MPDAKKKIAIVASQFPETNETFVIRELAALSNGGLPIHIYSLKTCRDRIRHPEATALECITTTMAWDSPKTWLRAATAFLLSPVKAIKGLGWIVRHESGSVMNMAKAGVIWMQSLALARRMQKDGITHVHAHWATMPTTAAVLISRFLEVRFSFTAHAWDIFVKNPSLRRKVELSAAVITCTDFNRAALWLMCPDEKDKIVLNYHGVNVHKFARAVSRTDISETSPLFLSVGRFVEQKGYEDLVAAYRDLHERDFDFQAVIVGEGPLLKKIESQIVDYGLVNKVRITAAMPQQELVDLYKRACAFVLPCVIAEDGDRDGIPNVILEALAAGLPVISTTVSGVPEAVIHGKNGLCVEPHSPAELSAAIESIVRDDDIREQMAVEARRLAVATFADDIHMPTLVKLMGEIASIRV